MKYNPALDGVRAVAVLAVVGYHCEAPFLIGGHIGVDVFFVLSGFLITSILLSELAETSRISLRRFYWRRALRLWPALLIMLMAYLAAVPIVFPDTNGLLDVLVSGFYLSDYTRAFWGFPIYLSHTWSLSVEEHFYLLWPVLLTFLWRFAGQRIALILAIAFIVATLWRAVDLAVWLDPYRTYYRFDTRMSGLILGSLTAVQPWRPSRSTAALGVIAVAVLAVLAASLPILSVASFTWAGVAIDIASAALVLALAGDRQTYLHAALSWRPPVYIGCISYSIYLWHYPIARALRDHLDATPTFLIVAPLTLAIAALSFEFVEKPLREMRKRQPAAVREAR
ncbi:MAG: acyltransferase [Mesorhizobium sp.]|nr:MAG: acyltransferase [Mesorhizobium sp.]